MLFVDLYNADHSLLIAVYKKKKCISQAIQGSAPHFSDKSHFSVLYKSFSGLLFEGNVECDLFTCIFINNAFTHANNCIVALSNEALLLGSFSTHSALILQQKIFATSLTIIILLHCGV